MTLHERTTWVFATAGLDGRAIGSKSLLSCSYQGDGTLLPSRRKYFSVGGQARVTQNNRH